MKLWLDDIRDPVQHGHIGWVWARTAKEAIQYLQTGEVEQASLDHDLSVEDTLGMPQGALTGYDVVSWMEENGVWPRLGTRVHSMNPAGRSRMEAVIQKNS
jgi:hypothetical protein